MPNPPTADPPARNCAVVLASYQCSRPVTSVGRLPIGGGGGGGGGEGGADQASGNPPAATSRAAPPGATNAFTIA